MFNNYYFNFGDKIVENDGENNVAYKELMKMVNFLFEDFCCFFMMVYQGYKYDEIVE